MLIKKIDLVYAQINGFSTVTTSGVEHKKVLPYLSVVQATKGNYDISLGNGAVHNTGKAGFFVAPAGLWQTIVHNGEKENGRMTCRWAFLKVKINDAYYLDDLYRFPVILPEEVKKEMNLVFNRLFEAESKVDQYICYYQIIKLLLSVGTKKEGSLPSSVVSAIEYMENNYKEKIAIKDVAARVNLSPSHFFNVFKKEMGISPISYLNHYRLSLAVEFLIRTSFSISEIANLVGICDSIYFNKIFRKAYQVSPSEYRKTYQTKAE
ncbi:MAG: helix-turn-helix transcriptional regulator [Clostridia bacterium]|nr:helix-turn-helix transcriptional regulator [Clostridia bacterium]